MFLAQPVLAADDAFMKCREIAEISVRVACYDKIVDSRFPTEPSDSAATSTQGEAVESTSLPDAQSLFGTSDSQAKRIVETSLAIEQIDHIVATATDVRKTATRKLAVTLDNGQVWRQLDNQRLRLEVGDTVVVRKASLGSYLMQKQSGSRSIRVKRAN